MKELGPILIPAGSESNKGKKKIPPLSPTYVGRTLVKKIADIPQQKSWGNLQEQPGILQHMWKTDAAIQDDPDWANTLQRCREDPTEGYLYTILPTREVLPFSEPVAIAYEYPCTLGKEQEGLHKRLVYSSAAGIPLITPALSGRLRLQKQRSDALEILRLGKEYVGYVGDEVSEEDRPNPDIVANRWSQTGFHYECHHAECIRSAKLYFVTEEEYLAHWNAFHAAVSPWYDCPATGCEFVVPGEPHAFDCYMMPVQRCHVNHGETGNLERDSGKTSRDATCWGVNPCFRDVGLKDRLPPPRKIPVEAPGGIPVIGARWVVRQQMDSLYKSGFPYDKFLDHQPYWGEYKNRKRGGTSYKHQREKEVRQQRWEEEQQREEDVTACYSPASSSSRAAETNTQAEKWRLVTGMVRPTLPCGRVALSAALTYEHALVDGGTEHPDYWAYKRVMEESFKGGRSVVAYHKLPLMRSDRRPAGLNHGLPMLYDEVEQYLVPPMVKYASALLGDFMVLYQEREVHRRRQGQLEQQALETQDQNDAETHILRAELMGARKEIEWAYHEREQLEGQLQEVSSREEKAQKELQTSREKAAQSTGEIAMLRKQVGSLEDELACIRKTL